MRYGKVLMVLARALEEWLERRREKHEAKVRAEGLAEGRKEGLAEAQARHIEWHNRLLEAKKEGKPFNEPFPRFGSYHGAPPWE